MLKKPFTAVLMPHLEKNGRIASEEVTLEIIRCKCIPVLQYGTEACLLNKSDLSSLDFVINRLFMKLFKTNNMAGQGVTYTVVAVLDTSVRQVLGIWYFSIRIQESSRSTTAEEQRT